MEEEQTGAGEAPGQILARVDEAPKPLKCVYVPIKDINPKRPRFEIIQQWIKAIKSKKYDFGVNNLRDSEDKYSSLGILADILIKKHGYGTWLDSGYGYGIESNVSDQSSRYRIPDGIRKLIPMDWQTQQHIWDLDREDQWETRSAVVDYLQSFYPKQIIDDPNGGGGASMPISAAN